ncbi:MAG: hypothetical protein NZZ41_07215 [Candidatus Dojkabacteria bacterium]|nr:hypothetical protein [Candidatus Dojkabacteria bacterium]
MAKTQTQIKTVLKSNVYFRGTVYKKGTEYTNNMPKELKDYTEEVLVKEEKAKVEADIVLE